MAIACPSRAQGYPTVLSFAVFDADGFRVLVAAGAISAGDGERLQVFLASAGRVDEVWLDSGGGDAAEGPRIGRVIRRARLGTRVPAGFECHSSCTLAFLGGVVRNIEPGGAYGVHTFYNRRLLDNLISVQRENRSDPDEADREMRRYLHEREQGNALLAAEWQQYVQEMGISRSFLTQQVLTQQSMNFLTEEDVRQLRSENVDESTILARRSTIRCLDRATLLRYNVINVD